MARRRRVAVVVALVISACAGASPASATPQERATCSAVYEVGEVASSLLAGEAPPADERVVRALVVGSQEVQAGASMASNPELARDGERLARAAEALEHPAAGGRRPSQELVVAFRSLLDACRDLGVHDADAVGSAVTAGAGAPALLAADLPDGWEVVRRDGSSDAYARFAAVYRRCVGDGLTLPWGPMTPSDDFVQGGGARQIKTAALQVGERDAEAMVRLMAGPDAPACMEETFRRSSTEHDDDRYELLDVRAEPLPRPAPQVGLRTTMLVDVGGRPVTVHVDEIYVAVDGWFGRLQLLGAYEPLGGADELVDAFVARLRAAGTG